VKKINSMAAEMLRICAFLAPDAIPEELLVEALKIPLPTSKKAITEHEKGKKRSSHILESRGQQKPTFPVEKQEKIDKAVAILRAYSLIQRNPQEKTLSVHRLVQAVLREAISEKKRFIWVQRMLRAVNGLLPVITFENQKLCEQYRPHAQECVQFACQCFSDEKIRRTI
jgi:hypothetical protein